MNGPHPKDKDGVPNLVDPGTGYKPSTPVSTPPVLVRVTERRDDVQKQTSGGTPVRVPGLPAPSKRSSVLPTPTEVG